MRRFTIILSSVAVTFVLAWSSAAGQEPRFLVVFGELEFIEVLPPDERQLWEITPALFQADVSAPQKGVVKSLEFEITLIADPRIGKTTFGLRGPGLSVCSAHGPVAEVDRQFEFGGELDPDTDGDPLRRIFAEVFAGNSPSDIISEGPIAGSPFSGCGTVAFETISVTCDGGAGGLNDPIGNCTSNLVMHGFVHAHGAYGNYIGPTTVRLDHRRGEVDVRVIIPDGEISIQGVLPAEGTIYCDALESAVDPTFDPHCANGLGAGVN